MAAKDVATNPALASLHDIQTPAAIGAWPLAAGYWIMMVLMIIVLLTLFVYLRKRHQHSAAKRSALMALAALNTQTPNYVAQVNEILKRAALSYCHRDSIARLSGQHWYDWLAAQVKQPPTALCEQLQLGYQPIILTDAQAQALKRHASTWLKQALPLKNKSRELQAANTEAN